jgi:predicted ATPase
VLVAGEPGIGKTRLAAETARTAHARGATVLCGHCDEELGVPFQPFVEALRYYVDQHIANDQPERLPRLGCHSGDLIRLLPDLAGLIPDLPPALQFDTETERYRVFEAPVSQLDEGALFDALDEALQAQLVDKTTGTDAYRFAHALVQETLCVSPGGRLGTRGRRDAGRLRAAIVCRLG